MKTHYIAPHVRTLHFKQTQVLANSDYEVNSSKETDDNFSQRKQNGTIWGDDNKSPKKSIWE